MAKHRKGPRRDRAPKTSRAASTRRTHGSEKNGDRKRTRAIQELSDTILTLGNVHASCVAINGALQHQNAENDRDLALCLRLQVMNVLHNQVERLLRVGQNLGAEIPDPFDT